MPRSVHGWQASKRYFSVKSGSTRTDLVLSTRSFAMGFISIAKLLPSRFLSSQALLLSAG